LFIKKFKGGVSKTSIFRRKKPLKDEIPFVNLRKLSTIDFPGKICMDLTVAGCNYRCPFCPHEELIYQHRSMEKFSPEEIIKILRPRLGFLDGVSISGGEPSLHRGLIDFLKDLQYIGSKIIIKTNASKPRTIRILLDKKLVDYYSVFIPAPLSKYKEIINYRIDLVEITSSIQMIRRSGVNHEFRVKPVPNILGKSEILEIANFLVGAPRFVIERFEPEKSMNKECRNLVAYTDKELMELKRIVAPYFNETVINF
jgi:pyruvate formate lyase activating enzyme